MRHGEYKVPGGKLVVVDLDVVEHTLCNVEVSGDFFIVPESTIWRIMDALEGASATEDVGRLTERVARATAGAELVGITPEGVATAVLRATGAESA